MWQRLRIFFAMFPEARELQQVQWRPILRTNQGWSMDLEREDMIILVEYMARNR